MLNKLEPKHGKHEGRGKTGSRLWKTESVTLPEPTQGTGTAFQLPPLSESLLRIRGAKVKQKKYQRGTEKEKRIKKVE